MRLQFTLDPEEIVQAAWQNHWITRGGRERQIRVQTLILVGFIVYAWWLAPPTETGWPFLIILILLLTVFWWIIFPWLMKQKIQNSFRTTYGHPAFQPILKQTVNLTPKGIQIKTSLTESLYKPNAVLEISETQNLILVSLVGNQLLILPKSTFKNKEGEHTCRELLKKLKRK